MSAIQAIETEHAGVRFRSRLEARWAVFFDAMQISWRYEDEAFEYEEWRWLPDFFLPDYGTFVEVKGDLSTVDDDYLRMLGNAGHMLPNVHSAWGTPRGILLLGDIPNVTFGEMVASTHISHWKGMATQWWCWTRPPSICDRWLSYPGVRTPNNAEEALPQSCQRYDLWVAYQLRYESWAEDQEVSYLATLHPERFIPADERTVSAFRKARGHRFWNPK